MPKILKITIISALTLLGLVGSGAWYAASQINPEKLVQILSSTVKESTGRDLKVAGPVSVNVFPSLGITAEEVSLSNARWASNPNLLTVKRLEIDIQLLPLLTKQVEFNAINLSGLEVYLQTNKAGDGNWDSTAPTTNSSVGSSSNSSSGSTPAEPMKIEHLLISNAQIHYQEFSRPKKLITVPKLQIDGNSRGSDIDGQVSYSPYQLGIKGKTGNLRTAFNDWDEKPVKLDLDLALTVNGKSIDIKGDIQKAPKSMAQFDIKLNAKSVDLASAGNSAASNSTESTKVQSSSAQSVQASKAIQSSAQGKYVFSEESLPFAALPNANGKLVLDIAQMTTADHLPLSNVKGNFLFKGDQISAKDVSFGLAKGSVEGQLLLSNTQSSSPSVALKGLAKGFTLEQLTTPADSKSRVSGGDMQVAFNLKSTGLSAHELASRANGAIQISIGKGMLDSRFLDRTGDVMITAIDAINPLRKKTDQTVLECAVAYLPISNGVVNINNSVGAVTDRLDIVLNGTINLDSEALNIKIDPREKSGLTTGVDLAGLVKLQGTLAKPSAGVNKEGVVNSAVSIGLGILTGGATILAENAKSLATKSQPCKTALHSWSDIYPGSN
jgi:uncharacterized protein involved in outer membrane biogenesis